MKYLPLLQLYLTHTYYADGRCPDFLVEPTPATRRLLDNYRCIAKALPDGMRVLAAATDDGAALIQSTKGMRFVFQLTLRNPDFALFTDLEAVAPFAMRRYANKRVSTGKPAPLTFAAQAGEPVSRRAGEIFAELEISYGDSTPAIAPGPALFQLAFQARQARWKYYVATDNTSDPFRIVDQDKDAPLVFGGLNEPVKTLDSIATRLADQYPNLRVLRFMSKSAIPCRQQTRKQLQLFAGEQVAVAALPNPSLRNYAIDDEPGGSPGAACLFHIVNYVNNLGSTSGG
jgi:hypothetical protein